MGGRDGWEEAMAEAVDKVAVGDGYGLWWLWAMVMGYGGCGRWLWWSDDSSGLIGGVRVMGFRVRVSIRVMGFRVRVRVMGFRVRVRVRVMGFRVRVRLRFRVGVRLRACGCQQMRPTMHHLPQGGPGDRVRVRVRVRVGVRVMVRVRIRVSGSR